MEALYTTLRLKVPQELQNIESAFALRSLFLDSTTPNILGLSASSRPGTRIVFPCNCDVSVNFLDLYNFGPPHSLPFFLSATSSHVPPQCYLASRVVGYVWAQP